MKIAYLMDTLESIQPKNETTSHLMYECNQRGHAVYFLEPHDVYIRSGLVVARMRNITVTRNLGMQRYWEAVIRCTRQDHLIFEAITVLNALFLRSNPSLNYQTMEFLQSVNNHVFILNSTTGQILGNSKLYILNFPEIIPETHVSRDPSRLRKIIGAMRRKPKKGDFRTKVHAGGEVFAHRLTAREKHICQVIRPKLVADGLYFVGIDIIAGKLVEVNCVSPGGIPRINRLNDDRLERKVIDFIEGRVEAGNCAHLRIPV